ncbi:hypothetical protein FOZ63_007488 [Perkinsus olseni]|nr:hypothetical protein FOZ63_007488 [Perkinsus olseni]
MILAHRPAAKISEQATIADSVMHARKSAVEGGMPAKELEKAETALRHAAEFAKIGLRAKGIEQKVLQAIYAKSGIRFAMKEVASSLALQQHYSTAPEAIASKACQSAASSAREVRHQAEAADMHARDALHALDKYNAIATQKRVESQEGLGGTYCGELYGQSFSVDFDESGRATVSVLGQEAGAD